ncbi:DUF2726 domain-containing protein [Thaumasiovibrio subtropicus]|nr:DUF2726 domain-containing protein [Thaumasiovibrio subtropicus]
MEEKYTIFSKVRIADVLTPESTPDKSKWQRAFNSISAKHFDFVICDREELTIVCAIELNDKSHNRKNRKKRDEFVREICKNAALPFVEFQVKHSYTMSKVHEKLAGILVHQ